MNKHDKQILEKAFRRKYSKKIKKIEEQIFWQNKKAEIKQLKKSNRKKLGLTTTKLLSYYLFILFNGILLYALIAMWHFQDLTYLGVIISDIVAQIFVFGIYCLRAYLDTKSEEQIKLENKKLNLTQNPLPEELQNKIDSLLAGEVPDTDIADSSDEVQSNDSEYAELENSVDDCDVEESKEKTEHNMED